MPYEANAQIEQMPLKDLGGFIDTKFTEMKSLYEEHDGGTKFDKEKTEEFQARNAELSVARERFGVLRETSETFQKNLEYVKAMSQPVYNIPHPNGNGDPGGHEQPYKSLGMLFTESEDYKSIRDGKFNLTMRPAVSEVPGVTIKSLEEGAMKTTMTTSAGWTPYPSLAPRGPVLSAQRRPVVADLIPQDDTTQPAIIYYEETTFTNNVAAVAEGGSKPESALALTRRTQAVEKIATTLPVTDEQLADVPQIRAYIDNRLTLQIQLKEESYLLTGTGTPPQLQGFHTKGGIGSLARGGSEDNTDVVLRAITNVNSTTGFANATGIVLHPLNMQAILLLRTTTGEYIWGHPSEKGPRTLWGLPVVETPAETQGTGLIGDFRMYSHISRRLGIRIDVGFINEDFKNDILRLRIEERLSLEIYRAAAFCEVTSLN
jgi:HK97 family phage major capsid protein